MANTHETIADIIAWLRRPIEGENAYLTLWRDEIADRLEAAHKRERGDAAKLREALEELVANIEMRSSTFGLNVMVDTKTFIDAKAALAAPPRNCDRFADFDTAQRAYLRETKTLVVGDEIFDWLFAHATEQKGEFDEQK